MAGVLLQPGVDIRPKITVAQAKALLESLYRVQCTSIVQLNGYDDKNYRVTLAAGGGVPEFHGPGYVLKVMNSLDSGKPAIVDAQTRMMLFLGEHSVKCPRPVVNRHGEFYSLATLESGGAHVVRLLEFIPGRILADVSPTPGLLYDVGRYIAHVDTVLKGFQHTAFDSHTSMWMYASVPHIKRFLYVVEDVADARMVAAIVAEFEARVLASVDALEHGVIHGDFNEQNILVRERAPGCWRVEAILDFGDSQHSCLLFELAIALAYMMLQARATDVAGHVLAGYATIRPIPQHEYTLLKVCIAARLCQSLVLGLYSSRRDPANTYLLSTQTSGWRLLHELWHRPEDELYGRWRRVAAGH